jgi:hypothetical protein
MIYSESDGTKQPFPHKYMAYLDNWKGIVHEMVRFC